MATANMYRKFHEDRHGFAIYEQTDRHTDTLIAIHRTATGEK